jgi:hypothetical protein
MPPNIHCPFIVQESAYGGCRKRDGALGNYHDFNLHLYFDALYLIVPGYFNGITALKEQRYKIFSNLV